MALVVGNLLTYVDFSLVDTSYEPVASISATSTDAQIPTAKSVYDYVAGLGLTPDGSGGVTIDDNVTMTNLPTSDPGVPGRLWNSSGDLRIST